MNVKDIPLSEFNMRVTIYTQMKWVLYDRSVSILLEESCGILGMSSVCKWLLLTVKKPLRRRHSLQVQAVWWHLSSTSKCPAQSSPVSLVTVGILPQLEPSYLSSKTRALEEEGTPVPFPWRTARSITSHGPIYGDENWSSLCLHISFKTWGSDWRISPDGSHPRKSHHSWLAFLVLTYIRGKKKKSLSPIHWSCPLVYSLQLSCATLSA